MKTKYIVIAAGGQELLFPFPSTVLHVWMLEAVRQIKQGVPNGWTRPYLDCTCVGAGFIIDEQCYGRSESLNVDSRNALDTALLARGCAT